MESGQVIMRKNEREKVLKLPPFSGFCITPVESKEILFYTQSFARYQNIPPSVYRVNLNELKFPPMFFTTINDDYDIYMVNSRKSHLSRVMPIVNHELRNLAQHMTSFSQYITEYGLDQDSDYQKAIFSRLSERSLFSLKAIPELLTLLSEYDIRDNKKINLLEILQNSISHISLPFTNHFVDLRQNNFLCPLVEGNSFWFESFFRSFFSWVATLKQCTNQMYVIIDQINDASLHLTIKVDNDFFLPKKPTFEVLKRYIELFSQFFNFRIWITPETIELVFYNCTEQEKRIENDESDDITFVPSF